MNVFIWRNNELVNGFIHSNDLINYTDRFNSYLHETSGKVFYRSMQLSGKIVYIERV